ncbi:hypothetical protein KC19_9G092000 [Ceratodon purpureus]|uniref:Uncharacterized protein n=1 Tax=Ceratodon purpureus TaxID=3225 RepID=A0A8T0GS31_CERPU|nr:hypothetical protein KC19_9G092000 [Ceratodon purpureus]
MAAPNLRNVVWFAATSTMIVVLLAGLQSADAELTKAAVNLRDCDPDGNGYYPPPSPSTCPSVLTVIPKGGTVYPICIYQGSDVKGDNWWVYVQYGIYQSTRKYGFVADYYVDCGGVVCGYRLCSNPM